MSVEQFIVEKSGEYGPDAWHRQEMIRPDLLDALPLIPLQYLTLQGNLFDPDTRGVGVSQETALQGSWAALLLPEKRDIVLHALLQKGKNTSKGAYNRHAEVLLPYMSGSLIEQAMNGEFEPDVKKSAFHMGEIILQIADMPEELVSRAKKLEIFTGWVNNLQEASYAAGFNGIFPQLQNMLEKAKQFDGEGKKQFAQCVFNKLFIYSDNAELQKQSSYEYVYYSHSVRIALEMNADTSAFADQQEYLLRLRKRWGKTADAEDMAVILSKWNMESDKKQILANILIQRMFEVDEKKNYDSSYDGTMHKTLDAIGTIEGFSLDSSSVKIIGKWAVQACNDEYSTSRVFAPAVAHLKPLFASIEQQVFEEVGSELKGKPAGLYVDYLVLFSKPQWFVDSVESSQLWMDILNRNNGNDVLLRLIYSSGAVPVEKFMRGIIDSGHENWLIAAHLDKEIEFYQAQLAFEERRFTHLIEQATADLSGPIKTGLPDSALTLVGFESNNPLFREKAKTEISTFVSAHLIRTDLGETIKTQLDLAIQRYNLVIPQEVRKTALHNRGKADLIVILDQYMQDVISREAFGEIIDASTAGYLGDGIQAANREIQYIFALSMSARLSHRPEMKERIMHWFELLPAVSSMTPKEIREKVGPEILGTLKEILDDSYWNAQIHTGTRTTLRGGMSVSTLRKFVTASKLE